MVLQTNRYYGILFLLQSVSKIKVQLFIEEIERGVMTMEKLTILDSVHREMQIFDRGSAERIQHFTKVHSYAAQIGRMEQLEEKTLFILELTAILHDIGIGPSEEKFGFCNGKMQEEAGPSYAIKILNKFEISQEIVDRVAYLIGHHHSYDSVDGLDYRILLEADFLVNLHENNVNREGILSAYHSIFHTESGRFLCKTMFGLP